MFNRNVKSGPISFILNITRKDYNLNTECNGSSECFIKDLYLVEKVHIFPCMSAFYH